MINLIVGKKGSGKTKKLLDMANKALQSSNGNVIAIEQGTKLRCDLPHQIRLIDTGDYKIKSFAAAYGFLSGLCAGNYDITDIFVDSTFKICGDDLQELEGFIKSVNSLIEFSKINITATISMDIADIPESIVEISNII